MEIFCANYYPGEDKVTFANLQIVKQRAGEDLDQFIKRFEDVSLVVIGIMKKRNSWKLAYLTCSLMMT